MRLASTTLLALLLVCAAGPASAQDAQNQPAATPVPLNEVPVAPAPGGPKPAPTSKLKVDEPETAAPEEGAKIGVGARFRYIFLPKPVIELFLGHATGLSSVSVGGEVIRRKGNLDLVFGLEYANISPANGLYLEKGKDPSLMTDYPDYVTFDNFAMISIDGTFIWHTELTSFMQLRYGAGIGIGFLLGDIKKQKTACTTGTTPSQLDDPNTCPIQTTAPVRIADKPPVVPIVNLIAGLRFKVVDQLSLNIELGFRDVFFTGASLGYFF